MQYDRGKKVRLGLFILMGTLLFMGIFYLLGSSNKMFSKVTTVHALFKEVQGLRTGDHVRFSGIIVGTVDEMDIISDTSILLGMAIDRKMIKFIRKDSKAEIKPEALIGAKMVVIHSGTSQVEHIREGDYLESVESSHFEAIFHDLSKDLKKSMEIIQNLVDITEKINEGDGNMGRLLNDSSIAIKLDYTADNFVHTSHNLKRLTEQLNNQDSDLGQLLYDNEITTQIDSILQKLDLVAANTQTASRNLAATTAELQHTANTINHGDGAIHKVLYDTAFADTIGYTVDNLNQTLIELKKVAENLQHKRLFGGKKEK
jgi:phospholipid/cholesterol/gamma-HCH transport system substrate-binding protein